MKSNTRKKILALLVVGVLAVAGAAWALMPTNPLTLTGQTYNVTPIDLQKVGMAAGDTSYNTIMGYGTVTGTMGQDGGAAQILNLLLKATTGQTLEIAPAVGNELSLGTVPATSLQLLINDGATDNGEVLIRGANGDAPTNALYADYLNGTFVYGGTLTATHNNSLGCGWVAIQARPEDAPRKGATFNVAGVTQLLLGAPDPTGAATNQPFYLVRDPGAGLAGYQLATIKVDKTGSTVQDLRLEHGLGELRTFAAPAGGNNANDTHLAFVAANDAGAGAGVVGQYEANWGGAGGSDRATRLVKTGDGTLTIDSNGEIGRAHV